MHRDARVHLRPIGKWNKSDARFFREAWCRDNRSENGAVYAERRTLVTRYIIGESRTDYRWKRDNLGTSFADDICHARAHFRFPPGRPPAGRFLARFRQIVLAISSKFDSQVGLHERNYIEKHRFEGARGKTRCG